MVISNLVYYCEYQSNLFFRHHMYTGVPSVYVYEFMYKNKCIIYTYEFFLYNYKYAYVYAL